jgi:hypothetical protein
MFFPLQLVRFLLHLHATAFPRLPGCHSVTKTDSFDVGLICRPCKLNPGVVHMAAAVGSVVTAAALSSPPRWLTLCSLPALSSPPRLGPWLRHLLKEITMDTTAQRNVKKKECCHLHVGLTAGLNGLRYGSTHIPRIKQKFKVAPFLSLNMVRRHSILRICNGATSFFQIHELNVTLCLIHLLLNRSELRRIEMK